MKKKDWHISLAKELKKRDNPQSNFDTGIEAKVIGLEPLKVSILNDAIVLVEGEDLIISEWFTKRLNINKTTALSSGVLSDLSSAEGVSEVHSYTGSPCSMPNAIGFLASAIIKINTELLQLQLVLAINDSVLIVPAGEIDKFFVIDKL